MQKAVARWIAEQFKVHRRKAEPEACRLLAELVGDDLYELSSEVDKLATWAGGAEVTAADVEATRRAARGVAAVESHRRLGRPRRRRRAARGGEDARPHGRPDLADDPAPRRPASRSTSQRARAAHRLEEQGLSPQDAATQLGMKPYPAQKLFAQVRNFSGAELDDALIRLAELDHALKGGSRLANELELERALVDITQPRSIVKDAA